MDSSIQCPAVIVEWETILSCNCERAAAGLAALCKQLWLLVGRMQDLPEVVITYDPRRNSAASIQSVVDLAGHSRGWPGSVVVAPVPEGTDYYGHKNYGFSLTRRDAVVFLDSDLIPDEGWLQAMLEPLADFRVSVVLGNTYMNTRGLYAKCVALFWIFEARSTEPALGRTNRLASNSLAMRRSVFQRFPFPERHTSRGQCTELAGMLRDKGICTYLNSAAQTEHPPPMGGFKFIERAMHAGHDECSYRRFSGPVHPGLAFSRFWMDLRNVQRRIATRRHAIGAGIGTVVAGACLGFAYYVLKLVAYLITVISPAAVRRMFPY